MKDRSISEQIPARRRTPRSTYRLQMHRQFGFRDATAILPYLTRLGISDGYTSPIFKARPGSMHGYDITDHNTLNPELGSEADYEHFTQTLTESGLGYLLDFVPNHMGIDPETNPWWRDVLENGPSSLFAHYFDIDWSPVKPELKNKVLLPILGDQYGLVLERGELKLIFEEGALALKYFEQRLPINPREMPAVLKNNLDVLQREMKDSSELREFLSILTELSNLPAATEQNPQRIEERQREKEVARERLARLVRVSPRLSQYILDSVLSFNGQPGQPKSFDALHQLLEAQAYRLAYWKTASHEINYRRFFDINQLAGLRMERPEVFEATHHRLLAMLAEGKLVGVRLDHPDGLYDPAAYFQSLQEHFVKARGPSPAAHDPERPVYLLAEKILSRGESLRSTWLIDGTTGYDFLNLVNHLFIDARHAEKLASIYERFIGRPTDTEQEVYWSKKLIMFTSLASELNVLAHRLNDISEADRHCRDFTLDSLRDALREVSACFPVYRTYINGSAISPSDELTVLRAIAQAKRHNPAMEASIFDFLREMLAPKPVAGVPPEEHARRLDFAMKFQQYTAPVQAKGLEDTAFYRCNRLLSVNEVGGDLERFGVSVADFHEANMARQRDWPHTLLATATHDTKRGEDARVRLDVISELPEVWEQALFQWASANRKHKTHLEHGWAPDANDEYHFYQALLGAWIPAASGEQIAALPSRMRDYMIKAIREAKRNTSWIRPNEEYEKAMIEFVEHALTDKAPGAFFNSFEPLAQRFAAAGVANSLAQLALKMASPGIPDFYQGSELWDWNLVDPDNRRPVDYELRQKLWAELEPLLAETASRETILPSLLEHWPDGRIKLLITTLGLRFRKAHPDLFLKGSYVPLPVGGEMSEHVVAFAREHGSEQLIVLVPRLVAQFKSGKLPWGSTSVQISNGQSRTGYRNLFTGDILKPVAGEIPELRLTDALGTLPIAWLFSL